MRLRWWRSRRREHAAEDAALPLSAARWGPENVGTDPFVTLGFRDGTMVDVRPDSVEGLALRTAAAALVDRNPAP